jgi:hypothetical protein
MPGLYCFTLHDFTHQNCTGTAIALPAPNLSSCQVPVIPYKVQQKGSRGKICNYFFFIQEEPYQKNFFGFFKINIIEQMKEQPLTNPRIYYRIIAVWVICEAMLGGMIHGLKLPVSGLIVGSSAVICICLLAHFVPVKGAILKATIIVACFKMALSPHSPPPAYIAVFFQGLMGELIFSQKRFFRFSCILFGIIALVESAAQRILVLVILYGSSFWNAVNAFISKITGSSSITNYSLIFASVYLVVHILAGIAAGMMSIWLIQKSIAYPDIRADYIDPSKAAVTPGIKRKRKKVQIILFTAWLVLLLFYIESLVDNKQPVLPASIALTIFLRSVLIVLTWYLLINPVLDLYLKNWLSKQEAAAGSAVKEIAELIPATQYLFKKSWELSAKQKGWKRFPECARIILVNTLHA